jgi:hypothetical protein
LGYCFIVGFLLGQPSLAADVDILFLLLQALMGLELA